MITLEPITPQGPPRDPEAFRQTVRAFMFRGAREVANVMRREAPPDLLGGLRQSIGVKEIGEFELLVAPSVNYARMVAEGTGPAGGRERYFPRWESLVELVKRGAVRKEGLKWAKPGSKARQRQENSIERRARGLAYSIFLHGTKPNPFVERTAEKARSQCIQTLQQGVHEGLRAMFGGRA